MAAAGSWPGFDLAIENGQGIACEVNLALFDKTRAALRVRNPGSKQDGEPLRVTAVVTPTHADWKVARMVLFLPYDSIRSAIPATSANHGLSLEAIEATRTTLDVVLNVNQTSTSRWIMKESVSAPFEFRRNCGGPVPAFGRRPLHVAR